MKDEETKATLRLPTSLYEQIKRLAKQNHRSINKQMIYIMVDWMSIDTDRVVLKRLIETSTGFVTVDEFVADYEKNKEGGDK